MDQVLDENAVDVSQGMVELVADEGRGHEGSLGAGWSVGVGAFRDLRILSPEDIESWGYWILRILYDSGFYILKSLKIGII